VERHCLHSSCGQQRGNQGKIPGHSAQPAAWGSTLAAGAVDNSAGGGGSASGLPEGAPCSGLLDHPFNLSSGHLLLEPSRQEISFKERGGGFSWARCWCVHPRAVQPGTAIGNDSDCVHALLHSDLQRRSGPADPGRPARCDTETQAARLRSSPSWRKSARGIPTLCTGGMQGPRSGAAPFCRPGTHCLTVMRLSPMGDSACIQSSRVAREWAAIPVLQNSTGQ
jgi:hypothetical protein